MDAYEAIRLFNRSYIELTNEAIRRSRPGRHYVVDKLDWISHKLVQKIHQDWNLIIGLIRQLRSKIAPTRYVKLVVKALRNYSIAGGRANSEPRIRKRKARRERILSE